MAHDFQLENGQKTKSRVTGIFLPSVEYPKIDPRYDSLIFLI